VSYTWAFGDGASGSGVTTDHTYAAAGSYPVALTVADDLGATAVMTLAVSVSDAQGRGAYYTIAPCRLVDTRGAVDPRGGPAILAGVVRTFPVVGHCDLPATARAVALNVTVVRPAAAGNLQIFPSGAALPLTSAINYATGQIRANSGVYALGAGGQLDLRCDQSAGTADVVLDVYGYFVE
jgi:PKD repeat protein